MRKWNQSKPFHQPYRSLAFVLLALFHTEIQITTTRLKHGKFKEIQFSSPSWTALDQQRYSQLGNPAQGENTQRQLARASLARVWERNRKKENNHCILLPLWMEFPVFWEFLGIPGNSQKFPTMQMSSDLKSLELLGISGKGKLQFCEGLEFLGIPKNS